jgi:hypothetical protein
MKRAVRVAWIVLLAALVWPGAPAARAQEPVGERPALGSDPERTAAEIVRSIPGDLRSAVVLRYDCASEVGRREVTLFANGTVRLWDGPLDDQQMVLTELEPEILDGFLVRLDREDLSEEPDAYHGVEGEWIESCELDVPLREGRDRTHFEFNRYTQLSLGLSRLVRIAEEIGALADEVRGAGLDESYRPRRGDVLERPDGARFRIIDFTSDGKGLELSGVVVPLTLYLSPDALREVFARVVERGPEVRSSEDEEP